MIRLVACDLDGTLLDSSRRLPAELPQLIDALHARGIAFAAASGRQIENLYEVFGELSERMYFLADNGAVVCRGRERLYTAEQPGEQFLRPIEMVRGLPGASCIISCRDTAFWEDESDPAFYENVRHYYANRTFSDDLKRTVLTEGPYKVAVYCDGDAEHRTLPTLQACADQFAVVLAGADWVDLMGKTVGKGNGLRMMCRCMGISPADVMAFGDYLNDMSLLEAAGHSYCMENGHPTLKAAADYIAPSNDENGVVRAVCKALQITL